MATSNLQQEIGRLRTLQESYDVIADNLGLFTEGKSDLATAITAKGVQTAATDSLATMADNVREIVQETTTISGGEFYPQNMLGSSVWNLFQVAAAVKSQYISSGLYAGAIVAQYYKGYTTLDLTLYGGGYAACLTSDGDFYANDGEHTPIGIHTWHDDDSDMLDRYVVFLWLEDDYTFQSLSSGVCPRQIVVVGTCASIQVNYNRLVQLYAPTEFGELKNFRLAESNTPEGNWAAVQIWQNYKEHTTGTIFQNVSAMIYAEFTNLERVTGGALLTELFSNLTAVSLHRLEEITGGNVLYSVKAPNCNALNINSLKRISGGTLLYGADGNNSEIFNKMVHFIAPALETITGSAYAIRIEACYSQVFANLEVISFPRLKTLSGYLCYFGDCRGNSLYKLRRLELPELEVINSGYVWSELLPYVSHPTDIYPNWETFEIPELTEIANGSIFYRTSYYPHKLILPKLRSVSGSLFDDINNGAATFRNLEEIHLDSVEYMVNGGMSKKQNKTFPALEYIYVGYTTNDRTLTVNLNGATAPLLTDIELKDGYCKNLTCSSYTALTAENIVAHILNRLGVNQAYLDEPTNANKLTITLGATNLAKLTDEEKQIAIDKGFTLA